RRGEGVDDPVVQITLPEADREEAVVQIVDNVPGMTSGNLDKAVKAGWSGNNPTDNLGLFGMGFNIATARLGLTTEVCTTQAGDAEWHGLEIDFDRL
ncbi:ATP-binding protein, partial [Mesorhizobium sp. M8A.F.Ca.ET.181.01.1.1]